VILSVNAYMLSDDDFVDDCIYAKWMVMMWWIVCVNICIVVESYVHASMTDGDRFYIQLRWLWCAVGIMGWRPKCCWWRYRMHLEVVSRNISCCGMSPSCYNNWCSVWMWLIDYMLVTLRTCVWFIEWCLEVKFICHAINWGLIQCLYFQIIYVDYDWCEANS